MKPYFLAEPVREGFFELIVPKHLSPPVLEARHQLPLQARGAGEQIRIHIDDS